MLPADRPRNWGPWRRRVGLKACYKSHHHHWKFLQILFTRAVSSVLLNKCFLQPVWEPHTAHTALHIYRVLLYRQSALLLRFSFTVSSGVRPPISPLLETGATVVGEKHTSTWTVNEHHLFAGFQTTSLMGFDKFSRLMNVIKLLPSLSSISAWLGPPASLHTPHHRPSAVNKFIGKYMCIWIYFS